MESRLVLVIEDDEPTANELAAAIREADYEVVVSPSAAGGVDIATEIRPDCIVCDIDLPDEDGYWVARNIRTHPSTVSTTPFLFLSAYQDPDSRLEAFNVGADVYMTKPYRVQEVVAQVAALVHMASRLRQRRDSMLSISPGTQYGNTAIEGDMRHMSIATVLSVLGMERRTGVFEVVSKKRRAQVEIAGGYVVHGTIGGTRVAALSAMRVMLTWGVGRFSFTPLPPTDLPPSLRTVQALLLDAAKAEDEAAASMSPGGVGMLSASFGGPPSRPGDTGPPSSRAMRDSSQAPVSLTFDLIPSQRDTPEEMPAAEVSAAIDDPLAIFERAAAAIKTRRPPRTDGASKTPVPDTPTIRAKAIDPSTQDTRRPAASVEEEDEDTRRPPAATAKGQHVSTSPDISAVVQIDALSKPDMPDVSVTIDMEDAPVSSSSSVSIDLDEVDEGWGGDEHMLHDETPSALPAAREDAAPPTPRAGASPRRLAVSKASTEARRSNPAIVPPPDPSAEMVKPLPAPPAAPRQVSVPQAPRAAQEKARAPHRASPKKA